jgi:hypothetical protein
VLTHPRRRDLIAAAVGAGLREFDANLIIAVVQDAARRGELGDKAKALHGIAPSLAMVGGSTKPRGKASFRQTVLVIIATVLASLVSFAAMVRWLLSP